MVLRPFQFHYKATFKTFQGQSSGCSKTRLTLLWSCRWIRPPCTTVTLPPGTLYRQTESEPRSPLTTFLSRNRSYLKLIVLIPRCPSILGELLSPGGRYYWETIVSRSAAYRLGVAYSTASRSSPLGENSLSWCLQCVPTISGWDFIHFPNFIPFPTSGLV